MSTTSLQTLTLIERAPRPTGVPNAYLFNDAVSDAFGWNGSLYMGSPSPINNTVFLWESGCRTGDSWNCTKACLDPTEGPNMVWNTENAMFTLQNCVLYPILTSASERSLLVQDPPGLLEKYGIVTNDTTSTNSSANGTNHWPVVSSCVQEFCERLSGHESEACSLPSNAPSNLTDTTGPDYAPWAPGPIRPLFNKLVRINGDFMPMNFCMLDVAGEDNLPGGINGDIAGPGVLISYLQQYSVVLAAWLFVSINTTWIQALLYAYYKWVHGHDGSSATTAADLVSKRITFPRQTAIVITALADFQKSQIFFSLALQVACLFAVHNPAMLAARTTLELFLGLTLLMIVGASGVYPVVLNLLTLRSNKKKIDIFTLLASTLCIIVASVTWLTAITTTMKPAQLLQDDFNPVQCGGFNPQQYCLRGGLSVATMFDSRGSGSAYRPAALIVPYWTLVFIATEKFLLSVIGKQSEKVAKLAKLVIQGSLVIVQLWLLYGVVTLVLESTTVIQTPGSVAREKWTLGQIVAVTVWVPCLIEFVYMTCCGIEHGFGVRLASGYKVVKKDGDDIESVPGAISSAAALQSADGADSKTPMLQTTRKPTL